MLRRENILITEDYMSKTTSATHFTAPGEIECFDSSIHFGKESDRVEIQNCNIKTNVLVHCSKDDSYDFEIGALIALMKMCGRDKVTKACDELYKDDNYKNALQEMTENCEKLTEENEKLQHEYDLCLNSENALKITTQMQNKSIEKLTKAIDGYKNDLYKVSKRCTELEAKEDILNKQEETINKREEEMSVYFGGRGCGKQYKALVELFKKIDQKKVDEAYKEAYNTKLPLWQKEVLKQMYDVYKESKEKAVQIKGFNINIKPSIKREQMWNDILACGDCEHSKYVEVKKEDLETFAKECNEKKIFNIIGYEFHTQEFWFADDRCIFQIFRKPAGFICAKSVGFAYEDTIIDYLPPMRWDLFKKGRKIVRVTPENIDDFIVKCTNKFGSIMKPVLKRYKDFTHIFVMISDYHYDNKPTIHIMTPEDLVRNQHENSKKYSDKKIVDWEDVR